MKKAIIYTRVSSNEQIENTSIKQQLEKCKLFAQLKDFKIVRHYSDKGFSGKNFDRPAFQCLMREKNNFDVIICYALDRFSRSTFELLEVIKELKHDNKDVYFLNPMIDTSDKYGEFFMTVLSALAQLERGILLERTSNGIRVRFKEGKLQNRAPLGYNNNGSINPKQAKIVKRIFKLRLENPLIPIKELSKKFQIPNSSMHVILRNRFYTGYVKYRKEFRKGKHQAIISKEDFQKVQELFRDCRRRKIK